MKQLALLVLVIGCGGGGKTTKLECPAPTPVAQPVAAPTDKQTEPAEPPAPAAPALPPGVELSTMAEKNMEKGNAALAANDLAAARAYFNFTLKQFPMSKFVHDAELGLLDADAAEYIAAGRDDVDTVNGHCQFIAHHPWHPRVESGDVACAVNKMQKTPCTKGDRVAAKYCRVPAAK